MLEKADGNTVHDAAYTSFNADKNKSPLNPWYLLLSPASDMVLLFCVSILGNVEAAVPSHDACHEFRTFVWQRFALTAGGHFD